MASGRQERKWDTDKIWKSGIGILLILLLLFFGIGSWVLHVFGASSDLFFRMAILMGLYGGANLAVWYFLFYDCQKYQRHFVSIQRYGGKPDRRKRNHGLFDS